MSRPRPSSPAWFSRASGDGRAASSVILYTSAGSAALHGVQRHIQPQNIDVWFADYAEKTAFDAVIDQRADGGFGKPPHLATRGTWK